MCTPMYTMILYTVYLTFLRHTQTYIIYTILCIHIIHLWQCQTDRMPNTILATIKRQPVCHHNQTLKKDNSCIIPNENCITNTQLLSVIPKTDIRKSHWGQLYQLYTMLCVFIHLLNLFKIYILLYLLTSHNIWPTLIYTHI